MKKVYIKPDINIISTPELCQEPPIVGGSNASTSDDKDPSLSKGHDSFLDWTDNGNDPWANDSRSLWDD